MDGGPRQATLYGFTELDMTELLILSLLSTGCVKDP